jgi:carbonic anhydrase
MKTRTKENNMFLSRNLVKRDSIFFGNLLRLMLLAPLFFSLTVMAGCNMEENKTSQNTEGEEPTNNDYVTQTKSTQAALSPDKAVDLLKEGNDRFVAQKMHHRDLIEQVNETANGQYPFAAVVSCIDSRIPTEIVFDQGVGDIFNARIAGNFVNTDILGSLEFATKVAGSKAIVVMGHTSCGAVKGAADNVELGNLTAMLKHLEPAVQAADDVPGEKSSENSEYVQKISDKNVELTIEKMLADSDVIREMYENGEITIVGAMYDVESGKVTFME